MEFFNKISEKASTAYKATAAKTGKLAKEAKLRLKMSNLKSQINDIYLDIGAKIYEKESPPSSAGSSLPHHFPASAVQYKPGICCSKGKCEKHQNQIISHQTHL